MHSRRLESNVAATRSPACPTQRKRISLTELSLVLGFESLADPKSGGRARRVRQPIPDAPIGVVATPSRARVGGVAPRVSQFTKPLHDKASMHRHDLMMARVGHPRRAPIPLANSRGHDAIRLRMPRSASYAQAFPIENCGASRYRRRRVDGDDIAVAPSCHPTSRGEQHGCEEEGEEEDEEKGEEEGKAEVAFPFRPSWSRSAGSRASSSSRATIGRPSPDPHKSAAPVPLSATRCAGLSGAQAFSGQRRSLFQLVPRPWASAARPGAGLRAASVSAKHCRP